MTPLQMDIAALPGDQGQLVTLVGRIDVFNYKDLSTRLQATLDANGQSIIVDLTKVEAIASSGWATFLAFSRMMRSKKCRLVIFGMREEMERVYRTMKLGEFVPSAADQAHALEIVMAPA